MGSHSHQEMRLELSGRSRSVAKLDARVDSRVMELEYCSQLQPEYLNA